MEVARTRQESFSCLRSDSDGVEYIRTLMPSASLRDALDAASGRRQVRKYSEEVDGVTYELDAGADLVLFTIKKETALSVPEGDAGWCYGASPIAH